MHAPDVMRYVGHNLTGEHRDVPRTIALIRPHVPEYLVQRYKAVMTQGCPLSFRADTTWDDFLLHLREGNHPSIKQNEAKVLATMTKEVKHKYNMTLPI